MSNEKRKYGIQYAPCAQRPLAKDADGKPIPSGKGGTSFLRSKWREDGPEGWSFGAEPPKVLIAPKKERKNKAGETLPAEPEREETAGLLVPATAIPLPQHFADDGYYAQWCLRDYVPGLTARLQAIVEKFAAMSEAERSALHKRTRTAKPGVDPFAQVRAMFIMDCELSGADVGLAEVAVKAYQDFQSAKASGDVALIETAKATFAAARRACQGT